MSQLITGIHHIALKCAGQQEFDKTVAFYRDTLGLPVARLWGTGDGAGAMLRAGDSCIEIFANADDRPGQGAVRHIALRTGDVDACAAAVTAAGYEVFIQPNDITIPSTPALHARMAFCYGPVGEQIEFFEEKPQ